MQRGLTIEQVAQDTRISARFLEALEAETFEDLPAPVYVRGFLRSYANFLHVDPTPLLETLALTQGAAAPASNGHGQQNGNGRRNGARQDPFARSSGRSNAPSYPQSVPIPSVPHEESWDPDEIGPDPRNGEVLVPAAAESFEPDERYEDDSPRYQDEPIPYRPRGVSGVLTEREIGDRDPAATSRMLGIIAGVAIAAIAILALAVFLTGRGGDDGGSNSAAAPNSETATPRAAGSVIAVASVTTNASASPSATVSGTPPAGVTGTPSTAGTPGTPTPTNPAGAASATPTPAETATPAATSTPAPTATPTQPPPTPTRVPTPPPHPLAYGSCDLSKSVDQCGSPPVRVICYPPFPADLGIGTNSNWFVDIPQTYPLQPGWKESFVIPTPGSIGKIIDVGQHGC